MSSNNNVHIINHPIVRSKLTTCRNANTTPKDFREAIRDIAFIIGIEASKDLEETTIKLQSPVNAFTGTDIKPRIGLTPILRAGLGMSDAMLSLFPKAAVYHIGLFREKISLQPVEYYSKLPREPTVDLVYILDPLIATAGTAIAALNMIIEWGIPIKNIRYLAILASEEGLKNVLEQFPDLQVGILSLRLFRFTPVFFFIIGVLSFVGLRAFPNVFCKVHIYPSTGDTDVVCIVFAVKGETYNKALHAEIELYSFQTTFLDRL